MYNPSNILALIFLHTKKILRQKYSTSLSQNIWVILTPAVMAIMYWFIFSTLFYSEKINTQNMSVPYALYFLIAYACWMFFQDILLSSINLYRDNTSYTRIPFFPMWIINFAICLSASNLFWVVSLIAIVIAYYNSLLYLDGIIWLILAYLNTFLWCLGASMLISTFSIANRDITNIVQIILNILFWIHPIIWVETGIDAPWVSIIRYSPLYISIDTARLFYSPQNMDFSLNSMWISLLAGTILCLLAFQTFKKRHFDVVEKL
ncbi:ABC transporter permease [bacterium]|nr:ABC transporter permease [bacterium]